MLRTTSACRAVFWSIAAVLASVSLVGCGGCEGDPGRSVFGVSCADAGAGGFSAGAVVASGTGPSTFRVPSGVTLLSIQASADAPQNFAVRADGRLIVNEVVGPKEVPPTFSGTYTVTPGTLIEVFQATGVTWAASADATDAAGPQKLSRSGEGDAVFVLPARSARYTITASSTGGTRNFVVRVGGRLIVNEILGANSWSGTFVFQAQEQVEITSATGVRWSFVESP